SGIHSDRQCSTGRWRFARWPRTARSPPYPAGAGDAKMADKELGGGEVYWRVLKDMWYAFDIDVPPSKFLKAWQRYRPEQQHLYATHLCDAEIINGGFHQFFHNQDGIL